MKALLLIAHGSRRQSSNDEVRALAKLLSASDGFQQVSAAFLELEEPSIPQGIKQCAEAGMEEIVIVPYFLSAGRHVVEDIPAEVAKGKELVPDANIRVTDYVGASKDIVSLLLDLATGE